MRALGRATFNQGAYMLRFYSPNGQRGCLWLRLWHFHITLGLTPDTAGFDISWRHHMILSIPGRQVLR